MKEKVIDCIIWVDDGSTWLQQGEKTSYVGNLAFISVQKFASDHELELRVWKHGENKPTRAPFNRAFANYDHLRTHGKEAGQNKRPVVAASAGVPDPRNVAVA